MKRILKGARKSVCEELTKTVLDCSNDNATDVSWEKLLSFSYEILCLPPKKEKRSCSLATVIRCNINNRGTNVPSKDNLFKSATEKLSDGDIKGCVRVLCSDEVIAPHNQAS